MNATKFAGRRLCVWMMALAFALGLFGTTSLFATQEQKEEKKEEKKDDKDKKDEKKPTLPLKSDRKVKFTTDEGTWLSLDLSPDGRTIVFELLGDIYTIPVEGGKATRLTSGQAFDAQPHYSPDGKSIVFVSDRSQSDNIWLMNADGTNLRALTRETDQKFQSPTFTPDRKST